MILSARRGYVFIHIPKTGGTALTLALEGRAAADDIIVADTPKGRARAHRLKDVRTAGRLWKHSTLADIAGLLPDDAMARLFVMTLVRNPWDRMVSLWSWARGVRVAHPLAALARERPFAAFVADPLTQAAIGRSPYGSYVTGADGQERCDAFIRVERFAEDAAPFERHLGFALSPLPVANESARPRDWRGFYDDRTAGIVARIAAADIARFGYGFDPG